MKNVADMLRHRIVRQSPALVRTRRVLFALAFLCIVCGFLFLVVRPTPTHRTAAPLLSETEYETYRSTYVDISKETNPREALAQLRADITENNALSRRCHVITHELGRNAFGNYADFATALSYEDDVCNSGYLHGVIEAYFSAVEDITSAMKQVCNQYVGSSFMSWECYHGVGHGLMFYTENDLPQAVHMCRLYNNLTARMSCLNGVFMENFNTDQDIHPSRYIKNDDSFYPCDIQDPFERDVCYLYAPTLYLSRHANDYAGALQWCGTSEKEYRAACYEGVGGQAIKENINDPLFVAEQCSSGTESQRWSCIKGMAGLYVNHFGAIGPAATMCGRLSVLDRAACMSRVDEMRSLFVN